MLCYSITSPLRYFDFDNGGGLVIIYYWIINIYVLKNELALSVIDRIGVKFVKRF